MEHSEIPSLSGLAVLVFACFYLFLQVVTKWKLPGWEEILQHGTGEHGQHGGKRKPGGGGGPSSQKPCFKRLFN